jgi:hypothetical protein
VRLNNDGWVMGFIRDNGAIWYESNAIFHTGSFSRPRAFRIRVILPGRYCDCTSTLPESKNLVLLRTCLVDLRRSAPKFSRIILRKFANKHKQDRPNSQSHHMTTSCGLWKSGKGSL